MRKFLSLLLSAAMLVTLLSAVTLSASAADEPIEAAVTEMTVGGNTVYVYAPKSELAPLSSTCTAPCFIVFGDEAYTEETAKTVAEASGLAKLAASEGATVVFINPKGETWGEADAGVYLSLIGMYTNKSTLVYEGGIGTDVDFMTGASSTKILGESQRIYVYAEGSGADFVAANYGSFTGAYRRQYGVRLPMQDYAAEGIKEVADTCTYENGAAISYAVYYANDLKVNDSNNPVPLVMIFHGGDNTALYHAQASEWPLIGKANGFITVSVDNHVILDATQTVELLEEEYAIDTSRVYASGFSVGSVKSRSLFEEYPELFAGLAPMDGSFANAVGDPSGVTIPVFYVGGEASILPELANQDADTNQIKDRLAYTFKANDVIQKYSYDAATNLYWGVNGQVVYQVTDKVAFKDSTLTVNLFKSGDGRYYTALASSSNQNHEVYARNSWAAWDFLSQFSRGEDGSISIAPVTYSLASDDGKITDNSYNTGVATTFIDVPYGEYYDAPVDWAVENDITGGTGNNRFTPGNSCTRAQIVTFLYKQFGVKE